MQHEALHHLSAAIAALGIAGVAFAQEVSPLLPPIERQAGIEYRTGGIGVDESTALEKESRAWPLTVIFAIHEGERSSYAADVAFVIRDAKGAVVLQGRSGGPYLLARLGPGRYGLEATIGGVIRKHAFAVGQGARHRHVMLWSAREHPRLRDSR